MGCRLNFLRSRFFLLIIFIFGILAILPMMVSADSFGVQCGQNDGNYTRCSAQGSACSWINNSAILNSTNLVPKNTFCPYNSSSFNTTYSSITGNALVNAGCCASGGGGTQGCFTYDKNQSACSNDNTCDWKANNANQNPWCWNNVGCCQKKGCWSFNGNNNTCIASLDGACSWSNKTLAGATNDPYCSDATGCCYDKSCNDAATESACNNLKTQLSKPCEWTGSTCGYHGTGGGGGGFTFYNDTDTCMKQGGWWNSSGSCNMPTGGSGISGGGSGGFLFASEVKCWFADQRASVCGNVSGCVYCNDATTELNNATSACFNMPTGMCQGHQNLSITVGTDINQSSMTCGDIRLKQTCSCGPMPNCVWSNSSATTGNFCTSGVKTASDTQSCVAPVQFCEDNKAKNNQTLCEQLASDYMMPCKWDAGSTGKVANNCTFNSVACFGSGTSGLGSFDFVLISGEQACTAAGGNWKTEYYEDGGGLKQDSWCEKGALFSSVSGTAFSNKGSCDSDCWACEFNASGSNYGGNVTLATSTCTNSKKGVCQWKNDSNAPNSLGWCDYPKEFSYGGAKDCNTDCKACEFSGNSSSASSACFGSIAGCTWINDSVAQKGGICISGSKKACNTDCFSCYDQQTCTNTSVHTALNCSWDGSSNFCKPSSFNGEICFNGKDDDNDLKVDCDDSDCSFDQFCGGSTVSTGSGFNATDCKKIPTQASCTANQTNGKNCTWADPDWGPAYCDFPGSSCWLYKSEATRDSCKTDIGCIFKNATAGYNITNMANGTINLSAFNTNIAFVGGRCDVNQTKVNRCTNSTLYNNQTECWKYNATESCTWINDTFLTTGGRCEFKPFGVCFGLSSASACSNEGNCTWQNDSYSQKGGFCNPVCFSLSATTCGNSGGLCAAETTACEPEHFSTISFGTAGGGCHQNDNNYYTCKNQNVTCVWKNFTFGNSTQGTCNEKGQFALLETLDMSPPKILGQDTNDTGTKTYVDIREYGIKDSTDTLAFGILVTNITDAVACKGYFLNSMGPMGGPGGPQTPIIGNGTNSTKFYWYLDTNKNTTDGCNATKADGTNDTGYEFLIKYAVTLANGSSIETRSFLKCANSKWSLTNVPLTSNRELMCGISMPGFGGMAPKTGGVMIVVDKENLESFTEYNKTAPMRVFVASANESKSELNPIDSVSGAGYYTQGSADFKFVDCSDPNTKDDKCKNFQKFGFNVFEDCKNGKDDDADGLTDCNDMKCSYTPNCASGGNAFNFVANANDFTTPSVLFSSTDSMHMSTFIKFDTDEPANGSISFYNNDSSCGNSIATFDEVGDTSITFDDFKPFHGVSIENGTNGVNLTNGTTYFYKTTICDPTNNCATSACLNFTTKKDNNYKPFVLKMKLPPGYNVTIPALNYSGNFTTNISGKVYETGIKTNASVTKNINVTVNCGTQSLTFVGVDVTKPKSIDLSTAFACNPSSNVLGMNSTSKGWNQVVSDLGMGGQSDYLKLTFPVSYDSGNTIKWCDDNLNNCTTVNTYANCSNGGTSKTDCKIPTSLGFSAYQVTVASSGSSSSSGGGGGGGGGAATATSFSPTTAQLSEGYTQTLSKENVVKFSTNDNVNHTATLNSITATTVTITVASTPQTATLNVGETKKFELTGDNSYDLSVTLVSITNATKATLSFKTINEQMPGVSGASGAGTGGSAGTAANERDESAGAGKTNKLSSSIWRNPVVRIGAIVIILVFIVAVIISAIHRTRHGSQKDIQGKVKVSARSRDIRVSSWFSFLFG